VKHILTKRPSSVEMGKKLSLVKTIKKNLPILFVEQNFSLKLGYCCKKYFLTQRLKPQSKNDLTISAAAAVVVVVAAVVELLLQYSRFSRPFA
jgi:hypothetical protein